MNRLAQNASAFLTEPMKTAIETARREVSGALSQLDDFVRDRYPAVKQDMEEFGKQMTQVTQALAGVEQRLKDLRFDVRPDSTGESSSVLIEICNLLKERMDPPPPRETFLSRLLALLLPSRRSGRT
jgi:hypothetical protein